MIEDYQEWNPPLKLNEKLFEKLEIYDPRRVWIGQAGIRQICKNDFEVVSENYLISKSSLEKSFVELDTKTTTAESALSDIWIEVSKLVKHPLHTLDQKKNLN